ncbi:hypothetical protein [Candidatus Enterovibrio escicola]|uniref:hypothetical protein n=1 Tax=Candidatus Enterovibrio escicola TaxID=1927127 RepID=UPI001237D9C1|nr:hypothetical protein [Candidatus Enterovibrio escacola]
MIIRFQVIAHLLANAFNYNRLVTVAIGLLLNEIFSLVVTRMLGITSMLHAPLAFVAADFALSGVLFALFYRTFRICKEEKNAWPTD